eukprot:gene17040-35306_t
MPDYSLGKIYKIVCNVTGEVYIGSTCETTLARRLTGHVRDCNYYNKGGKVSNFSSFQIINRGNYYIDLLESCPCSSRDELRKKEREWYEKLSCVNKVRPYATPEELKENDRKWCIENKTYLQNRHKNWRIDNLERCNEMCKSYYKRKSQTPTVCECGG